MLPSQRENWIDIAKGLGISLVVYGHVQRGLIKAHIIKDSPTWQFLDTLIYSFHMPLFFLLSGYFLLAGLRKYGAAGLLGNKFKSLVYPYILWSLAQGSLEVLAAAMTNNQTSWSAVLSLFWAPRAQFWFLYVLFLLFVLAIASSKLLLLARVSPEIPLWIKVLLPASLFARLLRVLELFPFPLDFISDFAFYFFLGAACYDYRDRLQTLKGQTTAWSGLVAMALLFASLMLSQAIQRATPVGQLPQTLGACLALLAAQFTASLAGSWLLISASLLLSRAQRGLVIPLRQLLQKLGQAAMVIYLMHILFGSGIRIVLQKFAHLQDPALHILIGLILSMALPYAVYQLSLQQRFSILRWSYEWRR